MEWWLIAAWFLGTVSALADAPLKAVFESGQNGYHTYRIPVLIRATNETLLTFCEGRKDSASDTGRIDLLLKRSSDGGATWSAQQVVWSDGTNVCGNPAPVVDQTTGTIWLLMGWNVVADTEKMIMDGRSHDTRRVFVTSSRDNGISWSTPQDITGSVKKPHWRWYATGPANGIQLTHAPHQGRLVIPANHSDHSDPSRHPYRSHVILSDDGGATWRLGGVEEDRTNESTVVELPDGTLLQNMRSYHGENRRAVARSTNGGETWSKVTLDGTLIDPVCEASLIRIGNRLVFANPASTKRERMTVRMSDDDGLSWKTVVVLHEGPSAYSSLVELSRAKVGCLFEGGKSSPYEKIFFAQVELREP
jgi:sialidase-1